MQRHFDLHSSIDDVIVRHNIAIGRDDDPAPDPMLNLRLLRSLHPLRPLPEELRKTRRQPLNLALALILPLLLLLANLMLGLRGAPESRTPSPSTK